MPLAPSAQCSSESVNYTLTASLARSKINEALHPQYEQDQTNHKKQQDSRNGLIDSADCLENGQHTADGSNDSVRPASAIRQEETNDPNQALVIAGETKPPTSPRALGAADNDADTRTALVKAKTYQREQRVVRMSRCLLRVFYIVGSVFAGLIIWQLAAQRHQRHVIAWSVAAIFVGIAVPISLHDLHMHLIQYVTSLQRFYIRILWMTPIYAIESWLALRFRRQKIYLETAREAYEAYVIYNLFMLMLHYLGGGHAIREKLKLQSQESPRIRLLFPFNCCFWKRSGQFINRCTVGVFQYVIIRFFCAFVSCTTQSLELQERSNRKDLQRTDLAIVIIINISQIVALYCLFFFEVTFHDDLKPINGIYKFLSVKAIVFLSFWQGLFIDGLANYGYITSYMDYTQDDVALGIQDFLICIEMAIISLFHTWLFSYRDTKILVKEEDMHVRSAWQAWKESMPWDVLQDLREHVFSGFGIFHKIQKRHGTKSPRTADGHHRHLSLEGEGLFAIEERTA